MDLLSPKDSAKWIASRAKHVTISDEGIISLGQMLISEIETGNLSLERLSEVSYNPEPTDSQAIDWYLVVDTLNFCFWQQHGEPKWRVNDKTGYVALCEAINKARINGIDILNPNFYANITSEQLKEILRGDDNTVIPLFPERLRCLQQTGRVLIETFEGSFRKFIELAEKSAVLLLKMIVKHFDAFRDEGIYAGRAVSFYKRAQILVADIWLGLRNQGIGCFRDIDELTMFADYRVPQVLVLLNVLHFDEDLVSKLEKANVHSGDLEELEIRGCCIHAVEIVRNYVHENSRHKFLNSVLIDYFLWNYRRSHAKKIDSIGIPMLKVASIYY